MEILRKSERKWRHQQKTISCTTVSNLKWRWQCSVIFWTEKLNCLVQTSKHEVQRWWSLLCKPMPSTGNKMGPGSALAVWYTVWIWGIQHIKRARSPIPPIGISVVLQTRSCLAATDTAAATWQQAFVLQELSKTSWMSWSYCCIPAVLLQLSDKNQWLHRIWKDSQKHRTARDLRRCWAQALPEQFCSRSQGKASISGPDCWAVHRPWAAVPGSHSKEALPCVCMELPVFRFFLLHKHLIENKTACPALSHLNYHVFVVFQNSSHRKKPGNSSE